MSESAPLRGSMPIADYLNKLAEFFREQGSENLRKHAEDIGIAARILNTQEADIERLQLENAKLKQQLGDLEHLKAVALRIAKETK